MATINEILEKRIEDRDTEVQRSYDSAAKSIDDILAETEQIKQRLNQLEIELAASKLKISICKKRAVQQGYPDLFKDDKVLMDEKLRIFILLDKLESDYRQKRVEWRHRVAYSMNATQIIEAQILTKVLDNIKEQIAHVRLEIKKL